MKDSEFLAELKAQEELVQRGFSKVPCEVCEGLGHKIDGPHRYICHTCKGVGYFWRGPVTK